MENSEAMKNKRGPVLITGGASFIGDGLIKSMMTDYNLIVIDKVKPFHVPHDVEFIRMDINQKESVDEAMKKVRIREGEYIFSVIHLANHNLEGTKVFMDNLFRNFDVGQFVYTSLKDEKEEKLIMSYNTRIPSIILRIADVYDEFGHVPFVVKEIQEIHERQLSTLFETSDGHIQRPVIHLADLENVFRKILEKKEKLSSGLVMNVCEDQIPSLSEIRKVTSREILGHELSLKIPSFRTLFQKEATKDEDYDLDNSKIKEELEWRPEHSIRETIPHMISNLMNYPGTWYRINKLPQRPFVTDLRKKVLNPVFTHL